MATIPPFVAKRTFVGQEQTVKAKKFIWVPVGSGIVDQFSDYEVSVTGNINILGYSGSMNICLKLIDEEPDAPSGNCILRLNSLEDDKATYKVDHASLTVEANFKGRKQSITISPCDGGTQTECKLFGKVNETVHLEPK